MKTPTHPLVVRAKRKSFVFICGKCLRKSDDGKSIRKALKSELSERAHAAGRRSGKLVETKCMGLCPKQAVVVANGGLVAGGELLIVKRASDVTEAVDLLTAHQERNLP